MTEQPAVTLDIINDCLSGAHGSADQDGNCVYCGMPLAQPTTALLPMPDKAEQPTGQTKTVICADGPLAGMTLFQVPLTATVLCEIYTTTADEPYFGTLYRPYVAMEAFYRCTGGTARLMFTRPVER
jgi:hypothetical protein